ncbi:MAG: hypothetical protein RIS43_697, partial [Actinomycetota bacterium]
MVSLLGSSDEILRAIESKVPTVNIMVRGNEISIDGPTEDVALLDQLFAELQIIVRTGATLNVEAAERSVAMLRSENGVSPSGVLSANILSNRGRTIRAKTLNQKHYVDAIDDNTIIFGIGPAGTGKTYLAVAKAIQALQSKSVNRIILTRPAVEAGEKLGFLP